MDISNYIDDYYAPSSRTIRHRDTLQRKLSEQGSVTFAKVKVCEGFASNGRVHTIYRKGDAKLVIKVYDITDSELFRIAHVTVFINDKKVASHDSHLVDIKGIVSMFFTGRFDHLAKD